MLFRDYEYIFYNVGRAVFMNGNVNGKDRLIAAQDAESDELVHS